MDNESRIEVIAIPADKAQKDRYYSLAKRITAMRPRRRGKTEPGKFVPKKLPQLAREALDKMMDEVEEALRLHAGE